MGSGPAQLQVSGPRAKAGRSRKKVLPCRLLSIDKSTSRSEVLGGPRRTRKELIGRFKAYS
jgi:hypothetical protein